MNCRTCILLCMFLLAVWEFGMLGLAALFWTWGWNGTGMWLFVLAIWGIFGSCKERCQ